VNIVTNRNNNVIVLYLLFTLKLLEFNWWGYAWNYIDMNIVAYCIQTEIGNTSYQPLLLKDRYLTGVEI
jgi:hypothetical protein